MDVADFAVAALGGFIAGMGMALFQPVVAASVFRAVLLHAMFLAWLGALFYIGRLAIALESGDGPAVARLLAVSALWATFAGASIPAGLLTYRRR